MTIREIKIHEHMQKLSQHQEYAVQIQHALNQHLSNAEIHKADVYYMDGDVSNPVLSGHEDRLIVLLNYPLERDRATEIRDAEGELLATYIEIRGEANQINIFPDLFQEFSQENVDKFIEIIKLIDTQVFLQKILDYSWKSTSKKEELTQEFTQAIIQQQGRYMRDDQAKVNRLEGEIREYTQYIKNHHDTRIRLLNQIETAKAKLDTVGDKLIKDLDNIVTHPKVKELFIKDGKFIVHTEPLYAYHDKTGDRYYIGNMRIEMNPQNTDMRFFGDNPRTSHWTSRDPHPHVNGRNGEACLGNIASTIAELSAQMELYALALVGIDFLESVNTSDPAGKNIINWDKVDEDGDIVEADILADDEDDEERWTCPMCEDDLPESQEDVHVFESYEGHDDGEGTWGEERYVCRNCADNHYTYYDALDEYVRDGECIIFEPENDEEEEEDEF